MVHINQQISSWSCLEMMLLLEAFDDKGKKKKKQKKKGLVGKEERGEDRKVRFAA